MSTRGSHFDGPGNEQTLSFADVNGMAQVFRHTVLTRTHRRSTAATEAVSRRAAGSRRDIGNLWSSSVAYCPRS